MISRLTGRLEAIAPGRTLIDVGGVAYEVAMPGRDIDALQLAHGENATVQVITDLIQRDDGPVLFGFQDWRGRIAFRTLRSLPGLGPSKALEVLDHLGVDHLHAAVAAGDEKAITRIPGIGPKMARRILSEWPAKIESADTPQTMPTPANTSARDEAVGGLKGLGYSQLEAEQAVDTVAGDLPDADARTLLAKALRSVADARLRQKRA